MGSEVWIKLASAIVLVALVGVAHHRLERNRGRRPLPHAVLLCFAVGLMLVLPTQSVARYIFSELAVTAVATVFPIYESVRAVCTPDEEDDRAWLQYWMAGGIIFMCSGWVDDVIQDSDTIVYWYEAMFFLFVWLQFPKTDGAALIYDGFTKPVLTPLARPLAQRMTNWISYLYQTMVNCLHLWLLWFIFMFLPAGLKRTVALLVGTVYPLVSSITAAASPEVEDDTYWLTYWSCYGCLFLIMDSVELWLGWLPGFYTLVIFATVYLMLPMFQGADKVFRKVLVPLAGLQELLVLRDAIAVKRSMLKDLDPGRAAVVRKAIAKFFDDDAENNDPEELRKELRMGWNSVSFRGPFQGNQREEDPDALSHPIV